MVSARNHLHELSGGQSAPQVFQCDDDDYWVLKLLGNPLGRSVLVADWVGALLAHNLKVPTPRVEVVNVSDAALATAPSHIQRWARPGPAFGSKWLQQAKTVSGIVELEGVENAPVFGRLHVLDVWIEVLDRRKPDLTWNMLIDTSTSRGAFVAVEFGMSLNEVLYRELSLSSADEELDRFPEVLVQLEDLSERRDAIGLMDDITEG